MSSSAADSPSSPCVDICVLDECDICMGCYRSAAEIAAWTALDDAGKRQVIARIRERRRAAGALL